jgi:F-type H+-transporting ATPase subunit epsilon
MGKYFKVEIVAPAKKIYSGNISSLIVPAALGYLGVLANHAPLIANLVPGKIILKESSGSLTTFYSESKGILEVLQNNVTLLLDKETR